MEQRYKLSHVDEGEIILQYAPEGWEDLEYTITRNQKYYGLFRSFSAPMKFPKDGKRFIDNVLDTYGYEARITLTLEELNPTTRVWERAVQGILNFDPDVYGTDELFTECNFEDSEIHKKLKNREQAPVAYNRRETFDGQLLPGFAEETVNVTIRGKESDEATAVAVRPWEAFNRVLQIICDLDYNPVKSSFFGRTDLGYAIDGEGANVLLSKGLLMRGFPLAGTSFTAGETNLNFKASELFDSFNKAFNLGLGLQFDEINDRYNFVIEKKNYFFQPTVMFTLDDISNLRYEFNKDLFFSTIKTGYQKFVEDNEYGLAEYNNQATFTTPISISDRELNLVSPYRADGTAFQIAIDNRYTPGVEQQNETDIDEDIFFVHAFTDLGVLKSVKNEGFDLVGGLYGLTPIQANIYLSPARNMSRWGDFIRSALTPFEPDGKLRYEQSENLSDLRSQTDEETETIFECRDFSISNLKEPRFSGRVIKFDRPLDREKIVQLTKDARGLVKFWDYINKAYNYGWIKECSTNRVDGESDWELWEKAPNYKVTEDTFDFMNGNPFALQNGEPLELMSQTN